MMNFSYESESRRGIRPISLAIDGNRLAAALEALHDGIAVFDENHRLVFANESYRDILGDRAEDICAGMALADIVRNLSDNGRILKVEETNVSRRGAVEWLLSDGRVIRIVSRPLPEGGYVCVGTDVTNTATRRPTLQAMDTKPDSRLDMTDWQVLGAAADALGIGIVLLNPAGEPEMFNENYRSFLGMLGPATPTVAAAPLSATKPVAHSVQRWRGEANDNEPGEARHALARAGTIQEGLTADGRVIHYVLRPLTQGNLLCVGVDVTERKRMEQDIARFVEEIESVRDAQARFLSSVSREFRAPLNAIIGYTQMMLRDTREHPTERQREHIEVVFRSAGYMLDLCGRIIDWQAIEAGRIEIERVPVSVIEVVQETLDLLAFQARARGVNMSGETVGSESVFVLADPIRFRQVMANLLSNAVKYNRPGGYVWVTCSVDRRGWCRIAIRDTGQGISHDRRKDIFKDLSRLGRAGLIADTSIGLSISKGLIERMGGRIGFESEPGLGSTFWIEMPCAPVQSTLPPSNGHSVSEECVSAAV